MFSFLALLALLLSPTQAPRDPRPFTPGLYSIETRDPALPNRYAGTTLDFAEGGDLIWNRDGLPYAMMRWSLTGDVMRIEDTDLCTLAPVGIYRVSWRERGFVFDALADDCHERSSSAKSMILVPVG